MSWHLCLANESDRAKALLLAELESEEELEDTYDLAYANILHLSGHFSYELLPGNGQLRKWLTASEIDLLEPDDIEDPEHWQHRDPEFFVATLCKVRERLAQESENMPVEHFLWLIDGEGERLYGATTIILPEGDIELKVPHPPMMRLDGAAIVT